LDVRGKFFTESGEVLEQLPREGCGCAVPGGVQGQVGWRPGQPGLVLNIEVGGPAWGRGWSFVILKVSSNPRHSAIL